MLIFYMEKHENVIGQPKEKKHDNHKHCNHKS